MAASDWVEGRRMIGVGRRCGGDGGSREGGRW